MPITEVTKHLAHNMRLLRKARKMSQPMLAHACGCSVTYISKLEQGRRAPSMEFVGTLATAFGVSPITLLREPEHTEEGSDDGNDDAEETGDT